MGCGCGKRNKKVSDSRRAGEKKSKAKLLSRPLTRAKRISARQAKKKVIKK